MSDSDVHVVPAPEVEKIVIDLEDTTSSNITYVTSNFNAHVIQLNSTTYHVFPQAFSDRFTVKGEWKNEVSSDISDTEVFIELIHNSVFSIKIDEEAKDDMIQEKLTLVRNFVTKFPKVDDTTSETAEVLNTQWKEFETACRIYWVDHFFSAHITPIHIQEKETTSTRPGHQMRILEEKQKKHKHDYYYSLIDKEKRTNSPYYSIFMWIEANATAIKMREAVKTDIVWPTFNATNNDFTNDLLEWKEQHIAWCANCIEIDLWITLNALLHCRQLTLLSATKENEKNKKHEKTPQVYTLAELRLHFAQDVHQYYFSVLDTFCNEDVFDSGITWSKLHDEQSRTSACLGSCLKVEGAFAELRQYINLYAKIRGQSIQLDSENSSVLYSNLPKNAFETWIHSDTVVFENESVDTFSSVELKGACCSVARLVDWAMERRQQEKKEKDLVRAAKTDTKTLELDVEESDALHIQASYPVSCCNEEVDVSSEYTFTSRVAQRAKELHGENTTCPDFDTFCSILACWEPYFYDDYYDHRYVFWLIYQGQLEYVERGDKYVQTFRQRVLPMQNVYWSLQMLAEIHPLSNRYKHFAGDQNGNVQRYLFHSMGEIHDFSELTNILYTWSNLFPDEQTITWRHYFTEVEQIDVKILEWLVPDSTKKEEKKQGIENKEGAGKGNPNTSAKTLREHPWSNSPGEALTYDRFLTHVLGHLYSLKGENGTTVISGSLQPSFEQALLKYLFPVLCDANQIKDQVDGKNAYKWFEMCEFSLFADWIRTGLDIWCQNPGNYQNGIAITPNQIATLFTQMLDHNIQNTSYYALYNAAKMVDTDKVQAGSNTFCTMLSEPHYLISCCVLVLLKTVWTENKSSKIGNSIEKYIDENKGKTPRPETVQMIWGSTVLFDHIFLPTQWIDMVFIRLYYVLQRCGLSDGDIQAKAPRVPTELPKSTILKQEFKDHIADLFYYPQDENKRMPICYTQEFIKMHAEWRKALSNIKEYDPSSRVIVQNIFHASFPRLSEERVWQLYKHELPDNMPNMHRVLLWEYVLTRQIQDLEMLYEYRHEVYQMYVCKHHELTTHYTTLDQHVDLRRPDHDLHTYFAEPLAFMTGDKYEVLRKFIRILPVPTGVHREARVAHFHQCIRLCVEKHLALRFAIMAHDLISLFYHHGGSQYYHAMMQEFIHLEIVSSPILVTELACFQVMVDSFARDLPRFYHSNMYRDLYTFRPRHTASRTRFCQNGWGDGWQDHWVSTVYPYTSGYPTRCSYTLSSQQWHQFVDHSTSPYQMMMYACRNVYARYTWKYARTPYSKIPDISHVNKDDHWKQVWQTQTKRCQEYMIEELGFPDFNKANAKGTDVGENVSLFQWTQKKNDKVTNLSTFCVTHWLPRGLSFMEMSGMLLFNLPEKLVDETLVRLREWYTVYASNDQVKKIECKLICSNVHDFEYYAHIHLRPWILYERNTFMLPLHQQAMFWHNEQSFLYARLKLWLQGCLHLHLSLGTKQWYYQMMHKRLNMEKYTQSFPTSWMIWPKYWRNALYYPSTLQLDNNDFSTLVSHADFTAFWLTQGADIGKLKQYTNYPYYYLWEYLTAKLYIPFGQTQMNAEAQAYMEAYNCWVVHKHPTTLALICKNPDFKTIYQERLKKNKTQMPTLIESIGADKLQDHLTHAVERANNDLMTLQEGDSNLELIMALQTAKKKLIELQDQQTQNISNLQNLKATTAAVAAVILTPSSQSILKADKRPTTTPTRPKRRPSLTQDEHLRTTLNDTNGQIADAERVVAEQTKTIHVAVEQLNKEVAVAVQRDDRLRGNPAVQWFLTSVQAGRFV